MSIYKNIVILNHRFTFNLWFICVIVSVDSF
nr:MAG TPA: hypothetical protein [Caudoviricetes sp.]